MTMRNIHIVSHTHWDREWYLPFQIFRIKLLHLVDGLLELLENDPHFKFFMLDGQTILIDDYLFVRPEKETILRKFVTNGRLIIGPWHILPDMFLVGPEAHIRNLMEGNKKAREFGSRMLIGYMPDSFGHIGQIPQILRGFGMEVASVWRGVLDAPTEFWWQAPEGSKVLMVNLREGYGNGADLPADNPSLFASMLEEKIQALESSCATSNYLIMYGTDHMEPPVNTSEVIRNANKELKDAHVLHSNLPRYVKAVQNEIKHNNIQLPTIVGELRACKRVHLLPGVLSTRMWIKQHNHTCENLLVKWVEPFTLFSWLEKYNSNLKNIKDNPAPLIHQAWRLLMENHPHDSICGCSIDQVHDEMKIRFDQVEQIGEEMTKQSLDVLATKINTNYGNMDGNNSPSMNKIQKAIIVFNPSTSTCNDVVTALIELPSEVTGFDLVDDSGTCLPYEEHGFGRTEFVNLIFDARELQSAFANINNGHVMGMTVQEINIHRHKEEVFINAILSENDQPNMAAWKAGLMDIEKLLADQGITSYHVKARTPSTTQVVIPVSQIPGFGYRTIWVRAHPEKETHPIKLNPFIKALLPIARLRVIQKVVMRKRHAKPPFLIENDSFSAEAMKDGTITIIDKRNGCIYRGLNNFLDGGDCGDEYNTSAPINDQLFRPHIKSIDINTGSVNQTISIELILNIPNGLTPDRRSRSKKLIPIQITTIIRLSKGIDRVDITTKINNTAKDHRLRVHFPVPFAVKYGSYDGHFEVVDRKIGLPDFDATWVEQPRPEAPQRAFTSVSDGNSALTIANRGLPEVEVFNNSSGNAEIAVTLLRCVGWLSRDDFSARNGHAGPFLETPDAQMLGIWEFNYSIIPTTGNWQEAYTLAYAFENPARAVCTDLHTGTLHNSWSFLDVKPDSFIISTIKMCEDRRGWLVRGYNITDQTIAVSIRTWRSFRQVEQVNLAEETIAPLKFNKNGSVKFQVRGHEIFTIRFDD